MKRCLEGLLLVCVGIGLGSLRDTATRTTVAVAQTAEETEHQKWTPALRGDVNADGRINITDAIFVLDFCFRDGTQPGPIASVPPATTGVVLPQTTQKFCWGGRIGTLQDPCPGPGEQDYGQDKNFKIGIPRSFELIKDDPEDSNTWYTIDHATGLTWTYVDNGERYEWTAALKIGEDLTVGGFTDWRMPNIYELFTVVDISTQQPSVNKDFFGIKNTVYWSSSSCIFDPSRAYTVRFNNGYVNCIDKGRQGQGSTKLFSVYCRTTD